MNSFFLYFLQFYSQELFFHGHNIEQKVIKDIDDRRMLPKMNSGVFLGRTKQQLFYRTNEVLVDGMCGGPVCEEFDHVPFVNGKKKIVRGLLEGIVPTTHPQAEIRGAAVFVENGEIREFLRQIEAGEVEPMKVGDVMSVVAEDQDPDKLDISKYL